MERQDLGGGSSLRQCAWWLFDRIRVCKIFLGFRLLAGFAPSALLYVRWASVPYLLGLCASLAGPKCLFCWGLMYLFCWGLMYLLYFA
ncbi:hypothetical protein RchiOBHm_Chr3g0458561 [Rosa chinensis]|nr:hypothetical protein RchiOBHm_Chr3g0458561 [Rosa chinensis]